jgi:hypothetical protein
VIHATARCSRPPSPRGCHGSFNLTGAVDYAGKSEPEIEFHNTGLYNIDGHGAYPPNNTGMMEITGWVESSLRRAGRTHSGTRERMAPASSLS